MLEWITGMLSVGNVTVQKPLWLLAFLPAFIILWFVIRTPFVEVREDALELRKRIRCRRIMLATRGLILLLLIAALATPVSVEERTVRSDPFINLLIDNSTSMDVFDHSKLDPSVKALASQVALKSATIASGDRSQLGDAILSRVKKGENVLLVTDGQSTHGQSLGDVALFAAGNNITLSVLRLPFTKTDAFVTIDGPGKTAAGTESTFSVRVGQAGVMGQVQLRVTVDDEVVIDTSTGAATHTFTRTLGEGSHRIVATIDGNDAFSQNNVYYKTVRAVPKPKVFFWTEKTDPPLLQVLRSIYEVDAGTRLPGDLASYYSVVLNDLPSHTIPFDSSNALNKFVIDGGGMVVVGGPNSYDRGGYGSHPIKNSLPVNIGAPGKDIGDVNVVVLLDASQSAGDVQGAGLQIARKLTIGLINDLDPRVRIGVVAFRHQAEEVSPLVKKSQIGDLPEAIASIYGSGGSNMADGIRMSLEMLDKVSGSKNLVIISDGLLLDQVAADSRLLAQTAGQKGVKVYTIGAAVGDEDFIRERTDEDLMKELADLSRGIYFRASAASRLKLLFNPPKDAPERNETDNYAQVLDGNHFITQGFNFADAKLTGYNQVLPKSSAKLLATLASGEPLLAVWRLGLGRVATLATDDGTAWAGTLESRNNSAVLLRTLNWAIGDPDRKARNKVDIEDGNLGEPLNVLVTSDTLPVSKDTTLVRVGERQYRGSVMPSTIGFSEVSGTTVAVNAPREYTNLGESKMLARAVQTTGGKFFNYDSTDAIVELAKSRSMETVRQELPIRWPLAIAIFAIWIIELIARRLLGKS